MSLGIVGTDNELQRLRELMSLEILDSETEPEYNDIVALIAQMTECPLSMISLVDHDRLWFKAKFGSDLTGIPRDNSFCDTAIRQSGTFIVHDTLEDPRFSTNPLVTGAPHIRFYAAQPLTTAKGHRIGTLCAIDVRPRTLNEDQRKYLEVLARQTIRLMELRLANRDLRTMQRFLQDSIQEVRQANEAKTHFLASMSHEIRTPLGAVLGFAELLRDDELSGSERRIFLETLMRNGQSLNRIIDDILDLAKVESGHLAVEKERFCLRALLADVKALFDCQARARKLSLQVSAAPGLPASVISDPLRLRQILANLVGNAIKFTESGSISVTADEPVERGDHLEIKIHVTDTGVGIADDQQTLLFRAFAQARSSSPRRARGTGLGLALSRNLARGLGGDVELVRSKPNQGSEFAVRFRVPRPAAEDAVPTARMDLPAVAKPQGLYQARILVIDDSPDNLLLIQCILERSQARVRTAGSGAEGIKLARTMAFDMILTDIDMPEMDGYQVLEDLRHLGFRQPILALTAHAMPAERLRTQRAGFDGYFTKPIDSTSLTQALGTYLRACL